MTTTPPATPEVEDLLQSLAQARFFLRHTVDGLTEEQSRRRSTVSTLHLAGLLAHVAATESQWAEFCLHGIPASAEAEWADAGEDGEVRSEFEPTESLEAVLDRYAAVAARTEEVVRSLPDLDVVHQLPVTPWWPEGGAWSARRALLHLLAETAQHAGHADLLRESLDGQKSMG